MRRTTSLLLSLMLAAGPAIAQNALIAEERWVLRQYDVDSTSATYFATAFPLRKGNGRATTVGSSTTVTALASGQSLFAPISAPAAGIQDWIAFVAPAQPIATEVFRIVATKTSDDEITVNTAITLTGGFDAWFGVQRGGTAATNGWFDVGGYRSFSVDISYAQGDLTDGLDWRLECKHGLGHPAAIATVEPVYPTEGNDDCGSSGVAASGYCRFATAPASFAVGVDNTQIPLAYCRVGVKAATADPSDAGANLEQVTISLRGVK